MDEAVKESGVNDYDELFESLILQAKQDLVNWNSLTISADEVINAELRELYNYLKRPALKMLAFESPLFIKYCGLDLRELDPNSTEHRHLVNSRIQQLKQIVEEFLVQETVAVHPEIHIFSYLEAIHSIWDQLPEAERPEKPVFVLAGCFTPQTATRFTTMIRDGIPGIYEGFANAITIPFDINGYRNLANQEIPNFMIADALEIPLKQASVDFIITSNLFPEIEDMDLTKMSLEFRRILKNKGHLVLIEKENALKNIQNQFNVIETLNSKIVRPIFLRNVELTRALGEDDIEINSELKVIIAS